MSDRYDIDNILNPRDVLDLERLDSRNQIAEEIIGKPAEIALAAVRTATDRVGELRSDVRFWKGLEESRRYEAAELREELKASQRLIRCMLAACAVLGGVVVFFGLRLFR
jgi:hypothetical protein